MMTVPGLENVELEELRLKRLAVKQREDLRDRMAIAAMNGLVSSLSKVTDVDCFRMDEGASMFPECVALASYRIADAMLEARQKELKAEPSEGTQP